MTGLPVPMNWAEWVSRWDRMQERYIARRAERFEIITRLVQDTQGPRARFLDLGCGTGSLMAFLLKNIPGSLSSGIDLDPSLLPLAEKRLAPFKDRFRLVRTDLRQASWTEAVPGPFDAVISATALHWLSPGELSTLYGQLPGLLRPGGIFLNADHAASPDVHVQNSWIGHRDQVRQDQADPTADDWEGFWRAYLEARGPEAAAERERALGDWQGVEDGLPLAWHFDHLRQAGFASVDCFWRCDTDAVFGGCKSHEG